MKSIRIVNALPSFYEIYDIFGHTQNTRYVFADSYTFRGDQLPSDDEFEILDSTEIRVHGQVILSPPLIDQFGSRFLVTANCIHVYDYLDDNIRNENILFKNLNWAWAYYCHDDTEIEIFIRNNYEEAYKAIKEKYTCIDVKFPGLISSPGGLNILD